MSMDWRRIVISALAVSVIAVAAGCPGTETLDSGTQQLIFEVLLSGNTTKPYDCHTWRLSEFTLRPLDGTCVGGNNPDDPCLNDTDCDMGVCEGSSASELITNDEIEVFVQNQRGNLPSGPCESTLTYNGTCQTPNFPAVPCVDDTPCPLDIGDPFNHCLNKLATSVDTDEFEQPELLVVTAGLYRMSLSMGAALLYDDGPDVTAPRCHETVFPLSDFFTEEELEFVVSPDLPKRIQFVIDVGELESVLPPDGLDCDGLEAMLDQVVTIQELN